MVPRGISRAREFMRGLCCGRLTPSCSKECGIARQVVAVVGDLVARGERQQHQAARRPAAPAQRAQRLRNSVVRPVLARRPAEIESSSAKTRKFASMAVLPELRNGDTTPESGSTPSTPELISSISKAIRLASPSARKKPKCVPARAATRRARGDQKAEQQKHRRHAHEPHSSPMAGSTRSVLPAGIMPGSPQPGPEPHGPPVEKRPERMRQLVAAAHVVVPRREPHVDALHHGVRLAEAVADGDGRHHQRRARPAPGRHVRAPPRTWSGRRRT